MVKTVEKYMEKHEMVRENDTVVVGVSGGADSLCLFLLLEEYCKKKTAKLIVVHVNHGIRKEASKDAEFVRELCKEFQVEFHLIEKDVPSIAKQLGIGTEEAGRKVRYEAFREVLKECGQSGKIAVAHNKGDQAETVLFHMLRGSNLAGLAGIAPVRDGIIRPLLCVERKDIEKFLTEKGRSWCIDSTNEENTYTRNKIRNNIMPYAEKEICAQAVSHIADTAEEMAGIRQYLEEQVALAEQDIFVKGEEEIGIIEESFDRVHEVIKKQLILRALEYLVPGRKDIGAVHIEDILALFTKETGKQVDLPYHLLAKHTYGKVVIRKKKQKSDFVSYEVPIPGTLNLSEKKRVEIDLFEADFHTEIPRKTYTKWFDYDKIKNRPKLRNRMMGDYLTISSDGKKKTVKEYFIEEKIPRDERDEMFLLADEDHIIWVLGMRISEYYKVTEQTKTILQVTVIDKSI